MNEKTSPFNLREQTTLDPDEIDNYVRPVNEILVRLDDEDSDEEDEPPCSNFIIKQIDDSRKYQQMRESAPFDNKEYKINREPTPFNKEEYKIQGDSTPFSKEEYNVKRELPPFDQEEYKSPLKKSRSEDYLSKNVKRKLNHSSLSPHTNQILNNFDTPIISPLRPSVSSSKVEGLIPTNGQIRRDSIDLKASTLKSDGMTPVKVEQYESPLRPSNSPQHKSPFAPRESPFIDRVYSPKQQLNPHELSPHKMFSDFAIPATPIRSVMNYNRTNRQPPNSPSAFSNYQPLQQSRDPSPPNELETIYINDHEYTILKEVGKGSSGKVYQVLSRQHGDFYALKWIQVRREEDRKNIMNEIELLKSLQNESRIVRLLEYHDATFVFQIVMEFGEIDLAHLIQRQSKKRWDITFIRHYWNQMLECVMAIHRHNIVHSDLKPANFVLVKGWLKLIDFGIAKQASDDTTSIYRGVQAGTVNYMSPEALMNSNEGTDTGENHKLGKPSDVWSLGCILYQMVYGKTPFYHLQLQQKMINIPNPNYAIAFPQTITDGDDIIEIPPKLLQLLKNCLDRDPVLRSPLSELLRHSFVNKC